MANLLVVRAEGRSAECFHVEAAARNELVPKILRIPAREVLGQNAAARADGPALDAELLDATAVPQPDAGREIASSVGFNHAAANGKQRYRRIVGSSSDAGASFASDGNQFGVFAHRRVRYDQTCAIPQLDARRAGCRHEPA